MIYQDTGRGEIVATIYTRTAQAKTRDGQPVRPEGHFGDMQDRDMLGDPYHFAFRESHVPVKMANMGLPTCAHTLFADAFYLNQYDPAWKYETHSASTGYDGVSILHGEGRMYVCLLPNRRLSIRQVQVVREFAKNEIGLAGDQLLAFMADVTQPAGEHPCVFQLVGKNDRVKAELRPIIYAALAGAKQPAQTEEENK